MNVSRLVGLATALVITATEWGVFATLVVHTPVVQAAATVVSNKLGAELPTIVVTAKREP